MNPEKYTERARGFIQSAQSLAMREGHQQFAPLHILKVLLDDSEGLAGGLIDRSGGNSRAILKSTEEALNRLPKVSGSGAGQVYLDPATARCDPEMGHRPGAGVGLADHPNMNGARRFAFAALCDAPSYHAGRRGRRHPRVGINRRRLSTRDRLTRRRHDAGLRRTPMVTNRQHPVIVHEHHPAGKHTLRIFAPLFSARQMPLPFSTRQRMQGIDQLPFHIRLEKGKRDYGIQC